MQTQLNPFYLRLAIDLHSVTKLLFCGCPSLSDAVTTLTCPLSLVPSFSSSGALFLWQGDVKLVSHVTNSHSLARSLFSLARSLFSLARSLFSLAFSFLALSLLSRSLCSLALSALSLSLLARSLSCHQQSLVNVTRQSLVNVSQTLEKGSRRKDKMLLL